MRANLPRECGRTRFKTIRLHRISWRFKSFHSHYFLTNLLFFTTNIPLGISLQVVIAMSKTTNLADFVELFEESSLEGDFEGFTRTVTDDETCTNAEYNINNQEVTHSVIETEDATQMRIEVDGKTISEDQQTPQEVIHTIARNTISSTEQ